MKACDFVAAVGDENRGVVRQSRNTLVRVEPVEVYGAGSSGAFGLLLASTWVCIPAEDLPGDAGPTDRRAGSTGGSLQADCRVGLTPDALTRMRLYR